MRRLNIILRLTICITVIAVVIASYNLFELYRHEKEQTLATVRKCAENAFILEMIGRMEDSQEVGESFIRLNTFVESAQQRDGIAAKSDSLRFSLASIMNLGLEFQKSKWQTERSQLDSIFLAEIHRNGLMIDKAFIVDRDSSFSAKEIMWKTYFSPTPSSSPAYDLYVSPMYNEVLKHIWGIIIPFIILIVAFSFLSIYLMGVIRKLRTLEQMKDDFTHNMTHELKTPVAVAYSAADSMLRYYDQSDETRNKKFLNIILQRLNFLSGMIEKILSMSMERFKIMTMKREEIFLKPLVEEVAGMIKIKAGKEVRVDIDIPDSFSISADSLHFGNMITNLLDNAVKYSGDSVEITIKADNNSLTVSDNGIGIEKRHLPNLFDKFYRITSGDLYDIGGYGLGLFYVKQIVELHGWRIEVESKVGVGSKFIIKGIGEVKEVR